LRLTRNRVLSELPEQIFQFLRPYIVKVELSVGHLLVDDEELNKAYFPERGIIALTGPTTTESVAVAMIGRDSMLGAAAMADSRRSLSRAVVSVPGIASAIDIRRVRLAAEQFPLLRDAQVRHERILFLQAQQSAVCNATHTVEARMARWLMFASDISGNDAMSMSQDRLARLLGVQRNSVSLAANSLMRLGFIRYSRGSIEVVDRDALKDTACECYGLLKVQYDRLVGPASAAPDGGSSGRD
jgi:CRP-like cAMP-binding protein